MTTVTWTTFSNSSSLVNVGSEAVCMLYDNILCFTDLKTKAISYYKAESPSMGLSIKAMSGHNKFALVAFCEVVLRPSVHIISYPKFTDYAVFRTKQIITFVDIRFNDYDLLLALSSYPHYTLCIWNFRNGQLLVQHDTLKESSAKSILCSYHHVPQIAQFSEWNQEILVWELCYSGAGAELHQVSQIQLSKDFILSNSSSMCYGDDNRLYVVDNFANLFVLQVAQFYLELKWSITDPQEISTTLKLYNLESHNQGLFVYSKEVVYFLHRKQNHWQCQWKLLAAALPTDLCKYLSNGNGEIYAAAHLGNLYQVEVFHETANVIPVNTNNENSIDFVILKGVKEECLLQLTTTQCVKALAMVRYTQYSRIEIPEANTIVAHNTGPYVMVGTSSGIIHFLNYAHVKDPVFVATIETDKSYPTASLKLLDKIGVYRSIYNDLHLLQTDFTNNIFCEIAAFEQFPSTVTVRLCFLGENGRIFVFLSRDSSILIPHVTVLWCYQWLPERKRFECLEFDLPLAYRDVGILTVPMKNIVEFFAVRLNSYIMDYLHFKTDTAQLVVVHSIQTNHLANISGITSSYNLLTWGVDGTFMHLRVQKKSPKPYGMSQMLQIKSRPRVVEKVLDCFNGKYLVYMYCQGGIKVMRAPSASSSPIENIFINEESPLVIEPTSMTLRKIAKSQEEVVIEFTPKELQARETLLKSVKALEEEVTDLINYDMSVTGKSKGIFKKFCLNHNWLTELNEEAGKLCKAERDSLEAAVADQSRIRDWIYSVITRQNTSITFKLRAIFSHFSLDNFGIRRSNDNFSTLFDLYRFYEMDFADNEDVGEENESRASLTEAELQELEQKKKISFFNVQGAVYDHVMCNELAMQDVNIVTANQMYNQDSKVRILLTDCLRYDFNKKFGEVRQIKHELIEAILATNNTLNLIYSNTNCMLSLLGREEFQPPQLSIPEWKKDEFVKTIMEVDDSEIKAINRRKKKAEAAAEKAGRLLLWSTEFWVRALINMMDGVLEKLWEEEIKKEIPVPEFLTKKEPAEYTLEDQKVLREYEEKCRILVEDRKKYLKILANNEIKTNEMKTNYILKLNENVTELMILKLKYDFAIEHVRLRCFNTKSMYFKKLQWLNRIKMLRADIDLLTEYIQKYSKLYEFWAKSVEDFRLKVDNMTFKQKLTDRQFRTQFLGSIPHILGIEMNKSYKKRPKCSPKLLQSALICKELAMRVNTKSEPKLPFPLPKDVFEYLDGLNSFDDPSNMPHALDPKLWDQFIKLRRQKVEMELRTRAVSLQLTDCSAGMNLYNRELGVLRNIKMEAMQRLQEAQEEYLKSVQNQTLELRLTMGQVEINIMGSMQNLQNCLLMNQSDINDINALILKAGQQKLRAMQKVAIFRRQVIYKEWEHKMVSTHIEYLNNMIYVIGKCKVTQEFLHILRNWERVKAAKPKMLNTVGLLEKAAEEKLLGYRREIIRINEKISKTRQQVDEMKQANKRINRQINDLKMSVSFSQTNRDYMIEEKKQREQNAKMAKIKHHTNLIATVRRDYVHIMELKTILELQRLRTYPTLGPSPHQCST